MDKIGLLPSDRYVTTFGGGGLTQFIASAPGAQNPSYATADAASSARRYLHYSVSTRTLDVVGL